MEHHYNKIKQAKRIVVKIGTSNLTYDTGRFNIRRIELLCRVLSDLKNQGKEIILVSSGAISAGVGKLGLKERPTETREKQALSSIGQCELMYLYDKLFSEYGQVVSQLLLTRSITEDSDIKHNTINTFETLIHLGVIPIVNENDTVAYDEILFGDNDTLSAVVSEIVQADLLVLLTDIDGLYDKNPKGKEQAHLIPVVEQVTDEIRAAAGGSGSNRGTGGMATKLIAADIATQSGAYMVIANGYDPHILYNITDGKPVGTLFLPQIGLE